MNIMITGGCGFVGSSLSIFLKKNLKNSKILSIDNLSKKYSIEDMIKGDVIFSATGVTKGDLTSGIKDMGESFESETYALHFESKTEEIIKNITKK